MDDATRTNGMMTHAPIGQHCAALLTGERATGKTTLCLKLAESRRLFTGLLTPAILDSGGRKIGFSARCLLTGDTWELGRSDVRLDGPRFGRFCFSGKGIELAVRCLQSALRFREKITIIDEIGPLELERKRGLAPVLPLLASSGNLLLVVRPALVSRIGSLIPNHRSRIFMLTLENRNDLVPHIVNYFRSESDGF